MNDNYKNNPEVDEISRKMAEANVLVEGDSEDLAAFLTRLEKEAKDEGLEATQISYAQTDEIVGDERHPVQ